jgi:hypothetical protein
LYSAIEIHVEEDTEANDIIDGEFSEHLWDVWEQDYGGYYNLLRVATGKVKRFTHATAKARILAYVDHAKEMLIPCDREVSE